MKHSIVVALLVVVVACTKPNSNRCCVSEADCAANSIPLGTTCQDGLVCRGNQCIAETCTNASSCEPAAPYCNGTGLCGPTCEQDAQCPGFGQDMALKYCSMGACIECRTSSDCAGSHPVCDGGQCRGCVLDTECASGACGDTGACADEASIVYVDAGQGLDAGSCTRQAPCKTLQFGIQNTLPTRSHVVMAAGTYVETALADHTTTVSPTVTVHGGGATMQQPNASDLPSFSVGDVATVIRDLKFTIGGGFGAAVQCSTAACTMERIETQTAGVLVGSNTIMRDVQIANAPIAIALGGAGTHLLAERVIVHGGNTAVFASSTGAVVSLSNLVVYDALTRAIDLTGVTGTVQFVTVADSGGSTMGAIRCSAGLTFQQSIVWTPSSTPIVGGCTINTTIAGPTTVTGAINQDPMFVDELHRDYHLAAGSPAIDQVDTGPTTDVDGTPRPQGARFDLGAFEKKP